MNNNKISAQLQDDIMRVLRGETTQKIELPTAIMEAAKQAAIDLNHAFLEEGYGSAERKREILRRNLNEGLKKCGCSPTADMIARFEEEAMKPVETDSLDEKVTVARAKEHEKKIDKADEKAWKYTHISNPNGMWKDGKAKSPAHIKTGKGLEKAYDKAVADYDREVASDKLYDKGGKVVKTGKVAKFVNGIREEEVEANSSIAEELKNFVANLTAEDRKILRGLLEEKN
jgi:hypothetical protein